MWVALGGRFFTLLPSLSSLLLQSNNHVFPAYSSFPFSYKEDACAQDVVESMEQVGDLASSCLKWTYEIFLGS